MAVKTKEDILGAIKEKLGDDTSDSTLSLIEDISDTINDLDTKASAESDWQKKYEDNDKMWREKYRDRFFSKDATPPKTEPVDDDQDDDKSPKRYEDLFTIKK